MRALALPLAIVVLAAPAGAQSAATPGLDSAVAPAVVGDAAPGAVTTPAAPTVMPTATRAAAPVADAAVGLRPVRAAGDAQASDAQASDAQASDAQAAYQRARRRGYGRSVALMATGGAAVVLGALAGGDAGGVLIFGGAIIGLIGLYDYLR